MGETTRPLVERRVGRGREAGGLEEREERGIVGECWSFLRKTCTKESVGHNSQCRRGHFASCE